ncbi:ATP-dependent nuclease subunit B [Lacticaseibacillus rhamnosus]|nr:ATP-dependent nuclease subunit B [Lacticaseibacillus rhamnosus]AXI93546.1 ATP-dependent nuclease subunit B [Lacticaseibacillus rhamnosus GG]ART95254.1 ATP-dependent nuclease subunit B [Lacticaseibacillus rhamnosus]AZZ22219.1 ATP-dependent nuclease subunit B [Lacticaseibacillus rhamnosus]MSC24685.1 ATP-dependent nuclease subunit B [Lacticaseibacillus rhamnosus]
MVHWLALTITCSPAQKPAHKDLGRNDQSPVITPKAAYAPVSNRSGSRSHKMRRNWLCHSYILLPLVHGL